MKIDKIGGLHKKSRIRTCTKAASKYEGPKKFEVPDKKAEKYCFFVGYLKFFGPSYFKAALGGKNIRKKISSCFIWCSKVAQQG